MGCNRGTGELEQRVVIAGEGRDELLSGRRAAITRSQLNRRGAGRGFDAERGVQRIQQRFSLTNAEYTGDPGVLESGIPCDDRSADVAIELGHGFRQPHVLECNPSRLSGKDALCVCILQVRQPSAAVAHFLAGRQNRAIGALDILPRRPGPHFDPTPGERTSPTQPFPVVPEPFARQRLTADLLTKRSPEAHAATLEAFKKFYDEGPFTPLKLDRPTVVFPGFDGGAEWGGPAADPQRGIIHINSNDIAWTGSVALAKRVLTGGAQFYQTQCAVCHGFDRKGSPPDLPSLIGIGARMSAKEILAVVQAGRGRMPAFRVSPAMQRPRSLST